jgi:hypothetical protein
MTPLQAPPDLSRYVRDPAAFMDDYILVNEKGKPWTLSAHQRRVLTLAFQWEQVGPGFRLMLRLLLWGEMKKSGKTFLAACLGLWWAYTNADTEVIVAANDLEQAQSRVFKTMAVLVKRNPELAASAKPWASQIEVSNGTLITAIAADYRGAAGSRHSLVIFDELWGYSTEAAERLFEELTPPPTEPDAWILVVTYAGWLSESTLLEGLYNQGLAGERPDDDLEVYRSGDLFMFWSHRPRQPWQTPEYYASQRKTLRPATYLRIHENRWVTAETTFITPEVWDPCVDATWRPLLPTRDVRLFVGVDAATKHDQAAVVGVAYVPGDVAGTHRIAVALHRVWKPTPTDPIDLEATIEAYLRELHARYAVEKILCDPFQMHRSIVTLKKALLRIEELPQTTQNTTAMGQALWDLLSGRNLRLYPSPELREQALNTVAVEARRGWRIAKERGSRKIDAIVALAMASYAAISHGRPVQPIGGTLESFAKAGAAKDDTDRAQDVAPERGGFFGKLPPSLAAARRAREAAVDAEPRRRGRGFFR